MSKNKRVLTLGGVSFETLELTPARMLTFLVGIGMLPTVRALLNDRGYDAVEHRRGWTLLERAANRPFDDSVTDETISSAIVELDTWDEPGFRLVRAGLTRHPAQRAFVLDGIGPTTGSAVVINISKLLDRLTALEDTPEGRAALDTLAKRGVDAAERKRLAALVKTAKTGSTSVPTADELAGDDAAYEQTLLEGREWFDEWSEIARLCVKRRDHLIRLGLAERRTNTTPDEAEPAPSPFIAPPAKPEPAPSPFLTTPAKPEPPKT